MNDAFVASLDTRSEENRVVVVEDGPLGTGHGLDCWWFCEESSAESSFIRTECSGGVYSNSVNDDSVDSHVRLGRGKYLLEAQLKYSISEKAFDMCLMIKWSAPVSPISDN